MQTRHNIVENNIDHRLHFIFGPICYPRGTVNLTPGVCVNDAIEGFDRRYGHKHSLCVSTDIRWGRYQEIPAVVSLGVSADDPGYVRIPHERSGSPQEGRAVPISTQNRSVDYLAFDPESNFNTSRNGSSSVTIRSLAWPGLWLARSKYKQVSVLLGKRQAWRKMIKWRFDVLLEIERRRYKIYLWYKDHVRYNNTRMEHEC